MTYSSLSGRWPTYTLPVDGCDLLICRKFVLTEKLSVIHLILTFFSRSFSVLHSAANASAHGGFIFCCATFYFVNLVSALSL